MRPITAKKACRAPNALGHDVDFYEQKFVVEESDLGRSTPHYLGYNHRNVVMTQEHVGRVRIVQTDDKGWTCWTWAE